jgi:hypothetical protein
LTDGISHVQICINQPKERAGVTAFDGLFGCDFLKARQFLNFGNLRCKIEMWWREIIAAV